METKEFKQFLSDNDVVVAKFGAEWCGPCKAMAPVLVEAGEKLGDKARILDIDVEESPDLATEYRIRNVPTILYFKGGELKDKSVGSINLDSLMEKINNIL